MDRLCNFHDTKYRSTVWHAATHGNKESLTSGVLWSFVLLDVPVHSMDYESANPGGEQLAQHLRGALGLVVHSTEYVTANLESEHLVQHMQ